MNCEICHKIIQRKNRTKHDNSTKHEYYSNLNLKTYIVKDKKLDGFKDVMFKYYFDHSKKLNIFTARVYWKVNDEIQSKLSVSHIVSYWTIAFTMSVTMKGSAWVFLDRAIEAYFTDQETEKLDRIKIGFISDLKDITFNHYMDQPKSMVCRKMLRRLEESKNKHDFEFKWIPDWLCVNGLY